MGVSEPKRCERTDLSPARVTALKKLAQRFDAHEQGEIKKMGHGIFKRHAGTRELMRKLRAKRLASGVSLTELAGRTGIAKSNLNRLENSERASPTLETLHRYAHALGMRVRVELN